MRTAPRPQRDAHGAVAALLRGGGRRRLRKQAIDLLDDDEHGERDDQKVDHGVDEEPVVEGRRARGLGGRERGERLAAQIDEQVGEVDAAEQETDRGHDDVVDERRHDGAEARADDDADREVDDVAPHDEGLELLQHGAGPQPRWRCRASSVRRRASVALGSW